MNKDNILDVVQVTTKAVVSIGTTVGTIAIEFCLLTASSPYHGGAAMTSALSKAGKLIGLPSMKAGGLVMVGTGMAVGYVAGEAVDHMFNKLRGRSRSYKNAEAPAQ